MRYGQETRAVTPSLVVNQVNFKVSNYRFTIFALPHMFFSSVDDTQPSAWLNKTDREVVLNWSYPFPRTHTHWAIILDPSNLPTCRWCSESFLFLSAFVFLSGVGSDMCRAWMYRVGEIVGDSKYKNKTTSTTPQPISPCSMCRCSRCKKHTRGMLQVCTPTQSLQRGNMELGSAGSEYIVSRPVDARVGAGL